jgi:hypothetical protein
VAAEPARGEDPDLTLEEHCEAFEKASGVEVSTATMSRRISGLPEGGGGGWPLKKVQSSLLRAQRRSAGALAMAGEALRDARRLVFVDESGFHSSMTRLRARAPRGKRAYAKVPRNRGKNQTLIACVTLEGGMGEVVSIEGATDAEVFETYVEEFLAPTLEAGQVVVLDR